MALDAGTFLNHLQVVARDQPALAVASVHLGLPPPVVLVAEDREDVALVESELFGDGCLVHVHSTCCKTEVWLVTCESGEQYRFYLAYQSAESICRPGCTAFLHRQRSCSAA